MLQIIRSQLCKLKQISSRIYSKEITAKRRQFSTVNRTSFPLRRAMMYVPGNDKKKIGKITNLTVDSVVLDCEDGVAINKKEEARQTILETLDNFDFGQKEFCVRINSIQSELAESDLSVICQAKRLPPTLLLPKVDTVQHIEWLADRLKIIGGNRKYRYNLIIYMESPLSLINMKDICNRAHDLQEKALFELQGIVFGSDDYCANIGAVRSSDSKEILFARQYVVTIAKAFNLQAIDMVYIDFKDLEGLRMQCFEGMSMGYTGKQVIHPSQVPVVQQSFSPSPEKISRARKLIEAFDVHQKSGKGAFVFEGNMIDMPLVLQARNIVAMSESTQEKK